MAQIEGEVCVIGAGSAGLSVAAGLSQLGLRTVLIEHREMGGECLNTGCVPSKALLAAGKAAHNGGTTDIPGISKAAAPGVDFAAVKSGLAEVIAAIAPKDSVHRFEGLGVQVLKSTARFIDRRTVRAGDDTVRAGRFVIATGSDAVVPAVPGLSAERVLTNETVFALRDKPDHLLILGGGPVGVEMALAHRRLGVPVTVVQKSSILPRDEPELVEVLRGALRDEGIDFLEQAEVMFVRHAPDRVVMTVRHAGREEVITGSHLLVAAGRAPRVAGLGLDAAGIEHTARGIVVDSRLRTTQRHVFALGDVIDAPRFTHVAAYQAGIVVRNMAFRLPAKVDYGTVPWVTYTDPELAHVGATEADARKTHGDEVRIEYVSLEENDRAVAERRVAGAIKIVLGRRDRILGVSILAPAAGEMIGLWCLAIKRKLPLRAIAELMLPYPTMSEIGKAAAGQHYRAALFGRTTRRVVRALQLLPRW
ncbi:dihydrolipoyl dehydrogenase family protein [Reyranella sp.]|uniref:dihydrolipoyl dehydrogenase family protein n=1 Tax=Reyranella sp. TaxID=1929291 RepID=UPI003D10EFA4